MTRVPFLGVCFLRTKVYTYEHTDLYISLVVHFDLTLFKTYS